VNGYNMIALCDPREQLLPGGTSGFELLHDDVNIEAAGLLALRKIQKGFHKFCGHHRRAADRIHPPNRPVGTARHRASRTNGVIKRIRFFIKTTFLFSEQFYSLFIK
jgi:hypothetical protein